jgi:pimeloyl-ACP methyl ester carboxylesterase
MIPNTTGPTHRHGKQVMRLQQISTVSIVLAAGLWLLYYWSTAPVLALLGAALCLFGYALVLAFEFVLLWRVQGHDTVPRASGQSLMHAWWAETRVAAQVFAWRQPFRAEKVPDQLIGEALRGQRGVVFIHGLLCNRGFWTPWLNRLQGRPHAFTAISMEPVFGSIDETVQQIDDAVAQVTLASGLPPVLVCHSMGGLAARAWIQHVKGQARVYRVVTIGTPHHGTWLARFGHSPSGRQMREGSSWLRGLDKLSRYSMVEGDPGDDQAANFVCWYSNCDNIVFPISTATLPGADNRIVKEAGHVQLAFMPELMNATLAMITGEAD